MVFVGHWHPEQGHNAIAQHLVHGAFIAVHRVHHDVQRRVQQCLGRFRIEPRDQFRRALEVGKKHRNLLALTFQGRPGGADFLGQVCRRVRQRGARRGAG